MPRGNGLFGLVIIANSGSGVVRAGDAKRTLDRLAVLNASRARVACDGVLTEIAVMRPWPMSCHE